MLCLQWSTASYSRPAARREASSQCRSDYSTATRKQLLLPSHDVVRRPSWLHGFSSRHCFVPDPNREGVSLPQRTGLYQCGALTNSFQQGKLCLRESFRAPQHPPERIFLEGHSMKPISVSLVRQLYLGKMRKGIIAWPYTDPLCASRGC